jgi:dipeptidyl aminopeptidase/acylaminoacyl peptidase
MTDPHSSNSKTPISADDYFRLRFIQDAEFSPDGRYAAYSVIHTDAASEEDLAALWLCNLESCTHVQITAGKTFDTQPAWSPDGRRLAFLRRPPRRHLGQPGNKETDQAQIFILPVEGGEPWALTSLTQGVGSGPVWSPDGTCIAFTAGPHKTKGVTEPYRIARHIYRFDGLGYLDDVAHDIFMVSIGGGEPIQLTDDSCHNTLPLWSPRGDQILYCSALAPDSHRVYATLRIVNRDGESRELLGGWGYAQSASWTPDSKKVVFVGNPDDVKRGSQENLWVIDSTGGDPECRSKDLDLNVGGGLQADMPRDYTTPRILVTDDGTAAYVQVQQRGTVPVYRIGLSGPEDCTPVVAGERSCFPQSLRNGRLLFIASDLNNPTDLIIAELASGDEVQISNTNRDLLASRVLPEVDHLDVRAIDGAPIEGWLLRPPEGTPPFATILYIHGGPHSGFGHVFSFDFQLLAGAGYAVLFANQRGSTGYGDSFSGAIIGDWGNLDYGDLMAAVDAAIERGMTDPDHMGCCGLSGGGNLTCWIVGHTDRFKAAVPENPVTNFLSFYGTSDIGPWFAPQELGGSPWERPDVYRRCSPITYAHNCVTPTLLIQGEADYRCPAEQSEQFYATLKANECIVEMLRLPQSAHGGAIRGAPSLRQAQNQALLDWMDRYVLEKT